LASKPLPGHVATDKKAVEAFKALTSRVKKKKKKNLATNLVTLNGGLVCNHVYRSIAASLGFLEVQIN
jgi:hypothetical protein